MFARAPDPRLHHLGSYPLVSTVMGVVLCLAVPGANMDSRVVPPGETGDYVVFDPSIATTLILAFQSLGYRMERSTNAPTTPRHGLFHLDNAVNLLTFTSILRSGRQEGRALIALCANLSISCLPGSVSFYNFLRFSFIKLFMKIQKIQEVI